MTDVATYILVRFIGQSLIKNMLPLFFLKNLLKVRSTLGGKGAAGGRMQNKTRMVSYCFGIV